jgi:hypothetical protein
MLRRELIGILATVGAMKGKKGTVSDTVPFDLALAGYHRAVEAFDRSPDGDLRAYDAYHEALDRFMLSPATTGQQIATKLGILHAERLSESEMFDRYMAAIIRDAKSF